MALVPIMATHGPNGVLDIGLMAGLILIAVRTAGAGRFIRYVPVPVVEGFTLGVAVIIGVQQVPAAMGVEVQAEQVTVAAWKSVEAWAHAPI